MFNCRVLRIKSACVKSTRLLCFSTSAFVVCLALFPNVAVAQSGLRESLERLDVDEDGMIDPDEITPLSRAYLERIAKSRRLSLARPNAIDKLQEAARIYYAMQNGVAGDRVIPEPQRSVRPIRPDRKEVLIPGFGLPEYKYPYTRGDLFEADETLDRYDRDGDQAIDISEAKRAKWTHRNPFDDDLDGDDRLNRLELTQRYARRRLLDGQSDELVQKARRVGNGIAPIAKTDRKKDSNEWWRSGGNETWLTASLMSRFDSNKNGRLELKETETIGLPFPQIDIDADRELTRKELLDYLGKIQAQSGGVSGVPGWFAERDADKDRQVSMAEYTDVWDQDKLAEFEQFDQNGDGLLTAAEVGESRGAMGGVFDNRIAVVLPPQQTIISTIDIEEGFYVADVNVQLSITHSHTSQLDVFLVGPDETRVELFTGVGGRDNHFKDTLFDDQASIPITKGKAPFEGEFLPEGLLKRQPSLFAFNGKPVTGQWQLVVRGTQSDRYGMLHLWNLQFTPMER